MKLNTKLNTWSTIIFTLVMFFTSCSKEFLNEPKNTSGITGDIVFSNRDNVQAFESGIYAFYKSQLGSPETGGIYSMYFARVMKGKDFIQTYNWYYDDYKHDNRNLDKSRSLFTWSFNYAVINFANLMIKGCENNPDLDNNTIKEFIAVAKAIRAFHYFELALEFAPNYKNNKNIARIPIYTAPVTDSSIPVGPSSLSDVFSLIISDLKAAINDLPEERLGKSYMRKSVAQGILARVLIVTQENWEEASIAARAAYGEDALSAVTVNNWLSGFDDISDPEWIWGLFQNGTNETNYYYMAPHVMTDHRTESYKATYISIHFRDLFSDTDIRKNSIQEQNFSTTDHEKYVTNKFAFSQSCDMPLMRKSEMVLIDAEAQYHLNKHDIARDLLFKLQKARDPLATMSLSQGDDLLNEILLERRKELYGEIGVEWFDAKRYNKPINRESNHLEPLQIQANSKFFYLQIPEREIDANPYIDNSINYESN